MSSRTTMTTAPPRLRLGPGGTWYLESDAETVWVAVVCSAGHGGGWFTADVSLDPDLFKWTLVPTADVLRASAGSRDSDLVIALTVEMFAACLSDGRGDQAVEIAAGLSCCGQSLELAVSEAAG